MKVPTKNLAIAALTITFVFCGVIGSQAANGQPSQAQPYGQQLTPQQREQAWQIYNESYAGMESTRQALGAKRSQLDMELASPNPDKGKIEALSREIGELRGKMLSARIDARNRLAQQGLPADCFGPCWNDSPMRGERMYGGMANDYRGWYHHGGGHHGGRGWGGRGGCWR